jgi:hypothetical protein
MVMALSLRLEKYKFSQTYAEKFQKQFIELSRSVLKSLASFSLLVMIAPMTTSKWPLMYFDSECKTTSAPSSNGLLISITCRIYTKYIALKKYFEQNSLEKPELLLYCRQQLWRLDFVF